MDYNPLQEAPTTVKVVREITSKQTIMFIIVCSFLLFAAASLYRNGVIEPVETPLMLIVGYFFGESTVMGGRVVSAMQSQQVRKD